MNVRDRRIAAAVDAYRRWQRAQSELRMIERDLDFAEDRLLEGIPVGRALDSPDWREYVRRRDGIDVQEANDG
jgi:hypothetical protein